MNVSNFLKELITFLIIVPQRLHSGKVSRISIFEAVPPILDIYRETLLKISLLVPMPGPPPPCDSNSRSLGQFLTDPDPDPREKAAIKYPGIVRGGC